MAEQPKNRFDSIEDNWQWAEGPWNDGAEARIVYKQTLDRGPTEEHVGKLASDSWRAGWADADMQLKSEYEALQNWSVKTSYDADNCRYDSIVGSGGEHIATVNSNALANYIVDAVRAYASNEDHAPPTVGELAELPEPGAVQKPEAREVICRDGETIVAPIMVDTDHCDECEESAERIEQSFMAEPGAVREDPKEPFGKDYFVQRDRGTLHSRSTALDDWPTYTADESAEPQQASTEPQCRRGKNAVRRWDHNLCSVCGHELPDDLIALKQSLEDCVKALGLSERFFSEFSNDLGYLRPVRKALAAARALTEGR